MQDIYALLDSKEQEQYCLERQPQLNIIEAGMIIHRSSKLNLLEKLEYFKNLISDYDDMAEIARNNSKEHYGSFKDVLSKRIHYVKNFIKTFEQENAQCVYKLDTFYQVDKEYSNNDSIFDSLATVRKYLAQDIQEMIELCQDDEILVKYRIKKQWLNEEGKKIVFEFNAKHEYINFTYEKIMESEWREIDAIENIWTDVPIEEIVKGEC